MTGNSHMTDDTRPTSENSRGLYNKFSVIRTDGRSAVGEKHHGCRYFVLDLSHDKFAYKALAAYANVCFDEYPQLSDDLHEEMSVMGKWMMEQKFAAMTPEDRKLWAWFAHNDPERR